jgi:uncharacterized damage-inducible protein DinB
MRNILILTLAAITAAPLFSQEVTGAGDLKAIVLKHLQTSQDFTVKVAEAMPDADYSFKLTPDQMTFGGQMVHLAQGMLHYLAPMMTEKPGNTKPASEKKSDVVPFVKASFETAITAVSKMSPDDLQKSYNLGSRTQNGQELIIGMFVHTAHHRASAEMYLRVKGVKPPPYQF